MYCRECGTETDEGAGFCPECGAPVGDDGGTERNDDPPGSAAAGTGAAGAGTADGDAGGGLRHGDGRPERSPTADDPSRRSRQGYPETTPPVVGGAVVGAVAYLIGYAVTYGLYLVETRAGSFGYGSFVLGTASSQEPNVAGWLFYAGHNVPLETGSAAGSSENLLQLLEFSTVPAVSFYLVGPAALVLVGFAFGRRELARRRDERGWATPKDGAVVGATLTLGYVALATVGAAVVFQFSVPSVTIAPSLLTSTLLMGVVYPLVFGTLGGALAGI